MVSTGSLTIVTNAGTQQVALAQTATATLHNVSLKWHASSPSTAVAHYAVDRAWKGASFSQITDLSPTTVAWTDTTAKADVTYQYRVRAVNSAGDSSSPSNTITVPIP
jgi:chitin-binding protein